MPSVVQEGLGCFLGDLDGNRDCCRGNSSSSRSIGKQIQTPAQNLKTQSHVPLGSGNAWASLCTVSMVVSSCIWYLTKPEQMCLAICLKLASNFYQAAQEHTNKHANSLWWALGCHYDCWKMQTFLFFSACGGTKHGLSVAICIYNLVYSHLHVDCSGADLAKTWIFTSFFFCRQAFSKSDGINNSMQASGSRLDIVHEAVPPDKLNVSWHHAWM